MLAAGAFLAASLPFVRATNIDFGGRRTGAPRHQTIRLGALSVGLAADLTARYDDNITRAETKDRIRSGWALISGLQLNLDWPVNPRVTIDSGIRVGYRHYLNGQGESGLEIGSTGDGLDAYTDVDFLVGDTGRLTLSNTFRHTTDSLDLGFQNTPNDHAISADTVALQYSATLSDYLSLAARAAHTATWTHRNRYGYQDHRHNALDFLVLWHANRALRLGPYIRWEQFTYRESKHNDATVIDTGLALNYASSENFIVEASVGWETINMDTTNRNHFAGVGATDEGGGPSARWRVVYMQSELTTHVLGGSYRRTQGTLAPTVNYTEELRLNYGISLYPVNNVSITPGIDWIRIDESDSGECADYYRIGLALGYRLTRDILLRMRYYYENRESDVFDRDYQRNVLEFGCHWRL